MTPSLLSIKRTVLSRDVILQALTPEWFMWNLEGRRDQRDDLTKKLKVCERLRLGYVHEKEPDEFAQEMVLKTFLILSCFFSSIDKSLEQISGKTVLCIGSHYGMEVLLLRCLGIRAYGIEADSLLVDVAEKLLTFLQEAFPMDTIFHETMFFTEDILSYTTLVYDSYDYIIGKNLNPSAPVAEILSEGKKLLRSGATMLIQWDAVYKEDIATPLYNEEGVGYNEKLRTLLDALYLYAFEQERPRSRFLYLIQNP